MIRAVFRKWLGVTSAILILGACSSGSGSGAAASAATYTLGGPYGGDKSGISCTWDGNAVTVRDGTGAVIGTTTMQMADEVGSGDSCYGQASWSVQVPQPSSGYYRVEIETDMGNGTQTIQSDLIPFSEAQAAGFKLYMKTDIQGLDFSSARIIQVPAW
jgi:hypothetical protein